MEELLYLLRDAAFPFLITILVMWIGKSIIWRPRQDEDTIYYHGWVKDAAILAILSIHLHPIADEVPEAVLWCSMVAFIILPMFPRKQKAVAVLTLEDRASVPKDIQTASYIVSGAVVVLGLVGLVIFWDMWTNGSEYWVYEYYVYGVAFCSSVLSIGLYLSGAKKALASGYVAQKPFMY